MPALPVSYSAYVSIKRPNVTQDYFESVNGALRVAQATGRYGDAAIIEHFNASGGWAIGGATCVGYSASFNDIAFSMPTLRAFLGNTPMAFVAVTDVRGIEANAYSGAVQISDTVSVPVTLYFGGNGLPLRAELDYSTGMVQYDWTRLVAAIQLFPPLPATCRTAPMRPLPTLPTGTVRVCMFLLTECAG
jgi:hypothetical protein